MSVNKYLITYNTLLWLCWAWLMGYLFVNKGVVDGFALNWLLFCTVAGLAEIVHSSKKWVKSSLFATSLQSIARVVVTLFMLWLPLNQNIKIGPLTGLQIVLLAWGMTELVRYAFYATSLAKVNNSILEYMRYTLFIVLYPLGVFGEWVVFFSIMKWKGTPLSFIHVFFGILLVVYLVFFPKLYRYMWQQRKAKIQKVHS